MATHHLHALKRVQAVTTKAIPMVATVISSHGSDSRQVLRLLGSRIVSVVMTIALVTKVALLLHGQVATGMVTAMEVMAVLPEALQLRGNNKHLHHRHLSVSQATDTVVTQEDTGIRVLGTEHHQRLHHQGSAPSCNNTQGLLLHQAIILLLHRRLTMHRRHHRPLTIHHRRLLHRGMLLGFGSTDLD